MIRAFAATALLALAACEAPAPRIDSVGEAARTAMDAASKAYAGCIDSGASTMPVADEAAGGIAIRATAACKPQRAALVDAVAAFNKIGFPSRAQNQIDAVAEASVKVLEDEARNAAVITIVKRQTEIPAAETKSES